jgi:NarL family two-component system response regulator LiaR
MRMIAERGALHTAVVHDPHPLWIDAVATVLDAMDVNVVGRTAEPNEALVLLEGHAPDLLITELHGMDGELSGLGLIQEARERVPELRVVVLASSQDTADVDRAFAAGAVAYVFKTAQPADVASAIRQTFDHSVFHATDQPVGKAKARASAPGADADEGVGLTRREREILALVSEGHSNRALAQMMWVTEQTVKFHLSNIYRKLDVSNRTEAGMWAHKHPLLFAAAEPVAV